MNNYNLAYSFVLVGIFNNFLETDPLEHLVKDCRNLDNC